jgi:hypothetical protein
MTYTIHIMMRKSLSHIEKLCGSATSPNFALRNGISRFCEMQTTAGTPATPVPPHQLCERFTSHLQGKPAA